MIVVQANLFPHGGGDNVQQLGYITIANDNTGTASRGNYDVTLYSRGENSRIVKRGRVVMWQRKAKTAFALVIACIQSLDVATLSYREEPDLPDFFQPSNE